MQEEEAAAAAAEEAAAQERKLAQALQEAQAGRDLHSRAAAEYDAQIRAMAEQVNPLASSLPVTCYCKRWSCCCLILTT